MGVRSVFVPKYSLRRKNEYILILYRLVRNNSNLSTVSARVSCTLVIKNKMYRFYRVFYNRYSIVTLPIGTHRGRSKRAHALDCGRMYVTDVQIISVISCFRHTFYRGKIPNLISILLRVSWVPTEGTFIILPTFLKYTILN